MQNKIDGMEVGVRAIVYVLEVLVRSPFRAGSAYRLSVAKQVSKVAQWSVSASRLVYGHRAGDAAFGARTGGEL